MSSATQADSDVAKLPWRVTTLPAASQPPQVFLVMEVAGRTLVFDDTPAVRVPKNLGATNVEMLIGHGIVVGGHLTDPSPVADGVPFTVVGSLRGKCVDVPTRRWLVGEPTAAQIRWRDLVELERCLPQSNTKVGVVWHDSLVIRGRHEPASFQLVEEADEASAGRARAAFHKWMDSPRDPHSLFGDQPKDARVFRFAKSPELALLQGTRPLESAAPSNVATLLRVIWKGEVVGSIENVEPSGLLQIGDRSFVIVTENGAELLIEVRPDGIFDAGRLSQSGESR